MVRYPSSAIERTRESIHSNRNPLEILLLLTCLVRCGMRSDKKMSLISEYVFNNNIKGEDIVNLCTLLDEKYIFGRLLTRDQYRLGLEPTGQYRHEEFLIGDAIEKALDIKLFRSSDPRYDFVSSFNTNWDLVGPVAPFYFDSESFIESLHRHLNNKEGLDKLVICTMTLDRCTQNEIREYIEMEEENTDIPILLLDQYSEL